MDYISQALAISYTFEEDYILTVVNKKVSVYNNELVKLNENPIKLKNEYYNKLVESANQEIPMSLEEQTKYQTDIFNAMRKELGISTKELKKASMIRA